MRPRWIGSLLIALLLTSLLAACGEDDIDDPGSGSGDATPTTAASPTSEPTPSLGPSVNIGDLTTLDWQLVELDGAPVIDGSIVTMTFIPDNRSLINGHADCHSYSAGIAWDDTSFSLSDSGPFAGFDQYERTCQHPDGGPEQDAAFFTAISEIATYHATDERLVFSDGDGNVRLTFAPRGTVEIDPALTDTVWQLTSLDGEDLIPGTTITIAFGPEGANGSDGCNHYGYGVLTANDGRLTLVGGAQTEMACMTPEGVMEQADRYYESLANSVSYRVTDDQLEMMNHDGATTLVFARKVEGAFDPALAAHRWGLIAINGEPPVAGTLVTLELAEGSISGSDGCNAFSGELVYAAEGTIEVAPPGFTQTLVGCPDDVQQQAGLVTTLLQDNPWYQIEGDRLTIGDAADNTLVYGPQEDVSLVGTTWNVPMLYTMLPDGGIQGDALIEGTEITLTFGADGVVSGSAGCNTFSGGYTIDGSTIAITTPLATTRMLCTDPPGIMEQEMTFLDRLGAVTTWQIGMNGLTLTTDDGRTLLDLNVVTPSQ